MVNERPGVYSSYTVTESRYSQSAVSAAAVAAQASSGEVGKEYTITSIETAKTTFGEDTNIVKLIDILFANGISEVKAVPVLEASAENYGAAFDILADHGWSQLSVSGFVFSFFIPWRAHQRSPG